MYANRDHVSEAANVLRNNDKLAIGKEHVKIYQIFAKIASEKHVA